MRMLKVSLSAPSDPYTDRGCFDDGWSAKPSPAATAAQRRDDYVCQFCGFQSVKYQVCFGPEGGGADALATACIFCEQVMNVDRIPTMKSAFLIWLPEIGQAALNRAMPEVYVNRIHQNQEINARARSIIERIISRRETAKAKFGSDEPVELVRRLRKAGEDRREIDEIFEQGLRIMPLDRRIISVGQLEFNQFPQIMAFWRSSRGPFALGRTKSFEDLELNILAL